MNENTKSIECPRCLGKGFVNKSDIHRLDRFVEWTAGLCGYCEGLGKINPKEFEHIKVNDIYLSSDLTREERKKYINQDKKSIERAKKYQNDIDLTIGLIQRFYFKENRTIDEILEIFQLPSEIGDPKTENFKNYIVRIVTQTQKIR